MVPAEAGLVREVAAECLCAVQLAVVALMSPVVRALQENGEYVQHLFLWGLA